VHEHIARTMYYFSVQLLYASVVGTAAWVLTSIRGASATTKYLIWVVSAFNFILPVGALVDTLWPPYLWWGTPLGAIGVWIWHMTQSLFRFQGPQPLLHFQRFDAKCDSVTPSWDQAVPENSLVYGCERLGAD